MAEARKQSFSASVVSCKPAIPTSVSSSFPPASSAINTEIPIVEVHLEIAGSLEPKRKVANQDFERWNRGPNQEQCPYTLPGYAYERSLGKVNEHRTQKNGKSREVRKSARMVAQQEEQSPSSPTATINRPAKDFNFPNDAHARVEVIAGDPQLLPDHIVLYKGKLYTEGLIQADGKINFGPIVTQAGGDFNYKWPAYYCTPEKGTAEYYRNRAARKDPGEKTCIIQIQIPNSFIDQLQKKKLWFDQEWRSLVWHSRLRSEPPDASLLENQLIIGPICGRATPAIEDILEHQIDSHLTGDFLLQPRFTNKLAEQWMFNTAVISDLGTEVHGKMHIKLFDPLQPAPEAAPGNG
ncbi:hypothetical protein N8T08_001901 [Aspergillus melleus]|uniref:Uncharacterized protein n=1 Tax=Aspergillus melleus TaxID=138277 RepID=A0ACC3B9U8_9EURO|nr:hypothetical protein N8T08_001901 [Aspergillus melleus]